MAQGHHSGAERDDPNQPLNNLFKPEVFYFGFFYLLPDFSSFGYGAKDGGVMKERAENHELSTIGNSRSFIERYLLIAIAGIFLTVSNIVFHYALITNHSIRNNTDITMLVTEINRYLETFEDAVNLVNTISFDSQDDTIESLMLLKRLYNASVVYVMNQEGTVTASTTYDEAGNTLLGFNYHFREYFKEAMTGKSSATAAVGVTTHKKGFYFSFPVVNPGDFRIHHVLVIKVGLEEIYRILAKSTSIQGLVSPDNILFICTEETLNDYTLQPVSQEEIKLLTNKGYWQLKMENTLHVSFDDPLTTINGVKHYVSFSSLHIPGWQILTLNPINYIALVIHHVIFTVILGFLILLLHLFFLRIRQRNMILKQNAEQITELSLSRSHYQALFEHAPITIWVEDLSHIKMHLASLKNMGIKDIKGYLLSHPDVVEEMNNRVKILDVNNYALTMYGATSKDHLKDHLEALYPEKCHDDFVDQLVAIAHDHTSYQGQSVNNRLDGSELTVYLKWIAAPGHEDDLSRVFLSLIDITPRVIMEKELTASREHLRLINRNLRHDITNNLSVIQSALRMYSETPEEALLAEAQDKITRSIDLIRDMSQLEVQFKKQTGLTVYEVRGVLESVAAAYPSVPVSIQGSGKVYADSALSSVFDNVIANAVQHSGTNRIDITIDQKQNNCIVRIVDYGKGIPDEMKDTVFDEGVYHGPSGHSGLGLYLVRETIERYHGNVHIEDALPWGTVVVITLRSFT